MGKNSMILRYSNRSIMLAVNLINGGNRYWWW